MKIFNLHLHKIVIERKKNYDIEQAVALSRAEDNGLESVRRE